MIRRQFTITSALSLLLCGGCARLSFRVMDPLTQKPVPRVQVQHLERHGDLMDFLMMLPLEDRVVATAYTDSNGRVKFDRVTFGSSFSFAGGRCRAYFSDDYWWIETDNRSGHAWKIGDDLYVPVDPRTSFVGKIE